MENKRNLQKGQTKQIKEYITRDATIGEIVDQYGMEAARIMLKYGLHCIGCHVSGMETLEEGSMGHGMPNEDFESMLKELNDMAKDHSSNKDHQSGKHDAHGKTGGCCNDTVGGSCTSEIDQTKDIVTPHNDDDPFFVTETAAKKALDLMEKDGKSKTNTALLVQVVAGGCSGFSYELSFCRADLKGDASLEQHGLKVVIGKGSLDKLNSAEIDYVDGLHGSGFKVKNPNAESKCGCGKSFN